MYSYIGVGKTKLEVTGTLLHVACFGRGKSSPLKFLIDFYVRVTYLTCFLRSHCFDKRRDVNMCLSMLITPGQTQWREVWCVQRCAVDSAR